MAFSNCCLVMGAILDTIATKGAPNIPWQRLGLSLKISNNDGEEDTEYTSSSTRHNIISRPHPEKHNTINETFKARHTFGNH